MKSIIILILFTLLRIHNGLAQSLSLNNLITIRGSDIDDINGILIPKGWLFTGAVKDKKQPLRECIVDEIMWTYGSEAYNIQTAHSFIVVERSYQCSNIVSYQTLDQNDYYKIREEVKKYNMKLGSAILDIDEDGDTYTTTTFVGNKYRIEMSVYIKKYETRNSYTIRLYLK